MQVGFKTDTIILEVNLQYILNLLAYVLWWSTSTHRKEKRLLHMIWSKLLQECPLQNLTWYI